MPFIEKYTVDFSNGNLQPNVNTLGWPAMTHAPSSPSDFYDNDGWVLHVTRSNPTDPAVANTIYIPFSAGTISLDTRLLTRVEFDLPWAEPLAGNSQPPSPWAVGLFVSPDTTFNDPNKTANVTCQFNHANGVRVNTPGGLQGDQSEALDPAPPDYTLYTQLSPSPNHPAGIPKARLTLEHSFCGRFDAKSNSTMKPPHIVGCGWLTIQTNQGHARSDHRVYSTRNVGYAQSPRQPADPPPPPILALGVTLITQNGVGNLRVRLRSFSLSFHS
jgi:hypothetical protein